MTRNRPADGFGDEGFRLVRDGRAEFLSPITSKCTTCDHFKVHHFGRVFF
jgi:hypothetical protein